MQPANEADSIIMACKCDAGTKRERRKNTIIYKSLLPTKPSPELFLTRELVAVRRECLTKSIAGTAASRIRMTSATRLPC
jgi:hypothetical protein